MAALRKNIADPTVRANYVAACVALDQADSGVTVAQAAQALLNTVPDLRFRGVDQSLSYYDLFVLWHVAAMELPRGGAGQNAAHSGPIFLPWHRHYMILLERWMQLVLGDDDFGLPYWDWAADGDLPVDQQWQTPLWGAGGIGPSRGDVSTSELSQMRVRIWQNPSDRWVESLPNGGRQLMRAAGQQQLTQYTSLPKTAAVVKALSYTDYDVDPWEPDTEAHRGVLEGWEPTSVNLGVDLHNLVHVWVGGDMGPGTSPNDPVFFLNHCNVDRIWEAWMVQEGRSYSPQAGQGPVGHRLDSVMLTLLGEVRTPADVLDPSRWYAYDSLQVT